MGTHAQEAKLVLPVGHTGMVTSASFSQDGDHVVTASDDGTIRIFDAVSGKELSSLTGHTSIVWGAIFSPDGDKILTAGVDQTSRLFNVHTGEELYKFQDHSDEVTMVQFSPDGQRLLTAGKDNTCRIYQTETGKLLHTLDAHSDYITTAMFSPPTASDPAGGKYILTASEDGTAIIHDASTADLVKVLEGHKLGLRSAVYSPDGKFVVTSSKDQTAKLFSAATGDIVHSMDEHQEWLNFAGFSWDGEYILTTSDDQTAKIFSTATGELLHSLDGHEGEVFYGQFSPDGRHVATASADKTVKIFEVATGKLIRTIARHKEMVFAVQYSPDGKLLLTSSLDKSARIFNAQTGDEIHSFKGKVELATTTSFSPDGKSVVLAGKKIPLRVFDFLTGALIQTLSPRSKSIVSAEFSPQEESATPGSGMMLVCGMDGVIEVFDRVTGSSIVSIKEKNVVYHATFSPDGKYIATAGSDKRVKIYKVHSGELLHSFEGHSDWVKTCAFSPDGKYLLSASYDKTARVFDITSGEEKAVLTGHTSYVECAAFSSDGKFLATGGWDKMAMIYEFPSCKEIWAISGHSDWVTALCFSPDGKQIVTAGRDKTAMIHDVGTGELLHTLSGHTKGITSVNYSPDGKYILTTAKDFQTLVWDSKTGAQLFTRLQLEDDDWLIYDPEYRYDGSEGARDYLYLVCGIELINLSQLKDALYVPGLSQMILSGEEVNYPGLSDMEICGVLPLIEALDNDPSKYNYKITPRKQDLASVEVYVNEKRIKTIPKNLLEKQTDHYLLSLDREEVQMHFIPGKNNLIELVGIVDQMGIQIQSISETSMEETEEFVSSDPVLYAVMIGVNEYRDTSLNLKFPVTDARKLGHAIELSAKKLLGEDQVEIFYLHSGAEKEQGYADPYKEHIIEALAVIGEKARPQDIVLIFFAGHGVLNNEEDKEFTFLTSDATREELLGISANELKSWLSYDGPFGMLANKTILIFDACHSGQATNDLLSLARLDNFSGSTRQVEDLKDKAGVFILAASAPNQVAYEVPSLEQGLLSYCLLHNMKNNPGMLDNGSELNVQKWFLETEDYLNQLVSSFGLSQNAQPFGTANIKIAKVDEDVRNSITLAHQKPMVIAANVLNDLTFDDDLQLKRLINESLLDLSQRGVNTRVVYPKIETPETNRINIRYEIMNGYASCDIRLIKKGEVLFRAGVSGSVDKPEELAQEIIRKVIPHAK
ncbi:caspase family protein [Bacteroidota bacterium]